MIILKNNNERVNEELALDQVVLGNNIRRAISDNQDNYRNAGLEFFYFFRKVVKEVIPDEKDQEEFLAQSSKIWK